MAKPTKKQPQPNPAIRLSGLRGRLDRLFADPPAALAADLDRLTDGLKPGAFLPILIGAAAAAAPGVAANLGVWLQQRGHLAAIHDLAAHQSLPAEAAPLARAWLAAGGLATDDLDQTVDFFYDAYETGNEFQGTVAIFGYTNAQRRRVRYLSFLIDYSPPWNGAVKDGYLRPAGATDQMVSEYIAFWSARTGVPTRLAPAVAKRRVLEALGVNQAAQIRLHPDVASAREFFARVVLPLPDDPATPAFTLADFDALAHGGRSAETLQINEQLFGYQTRMADGSISRIIRLGGPDDALLD